MKKKQLQTEVSMLDSVGDYFNKDDVIVSCECDLSSGNYKKTLVAVLPERICMLRDDGVFVSKKYSEIEEIYAVNYVSSGELIIKADGGEFSACEFTLTLSGKVEQIVNTVRKVAKSFSLYKCQKLSEYDSSKVRLM